MGILWAIVVALLALWMLGLVMNFVGPVIHLLLLAAAVLFVVNMFTGSRTRV